MSSTTPGGPGGPEYLDSAQGRPVPAERASSDNRKRALLAGGLVVGLAVAGGAAWAATSFLATGEQPAQALPANTLAYAAVDLDPSGGQKVEAITTLRKFPEFKDKIGLETDDDIRERIFTELTRAGECAGLDYATDVEPWLGDRAAVAAVDTGAEQPVPVVVLQVKDAAEADKGLAAVATSCQAEDTVGWVVEDDWALVAETEDQARAVAAADGSLADDETFQRWVDEAGDPGIMTFYAAPAAGRFMADNLGAFGMLGMSGAEQGAMPSLRDFKGAAATVRFDDGAVELEFAGDAGLQGETLAEDANGAEVVSTLPADTIAAVGIGLADGWFDAVVQQISATAGGEMTPEQLYAELEEETGLQAPEDIETLFGESVTIALGEGFDPELFFNGGPADLPVGVKIKGDADGIEAVLEKLRAVAGEEAGLLDSQADGDHVVVGPNADYRSQLLEDGDLAGTETYESVMEDADEAAGVVYVNFDAGDWLVDLAGDDATARDNLAPLSAFGVSAWRDGDTSHAVARLTTN